MKILMIVLAILAVSFFVFKNKIKKAITKKVQKKRGENKRAEYVYTPVGKTRSFSIDFTIEEMGNDAVKITIDKKITKEI